MMKIHTTQNLSSSRRTTNDLYLFKELSSNYTEGSCPRELSEHSYSDNVLFKGSNKKIVNNAIKKVTKKSLPEKIANSNLMTKIFRSDFFMKTLKGTNDQEVIVQSITSLAVCTLFRPVTIVAFPGEKDKKDCIYAASHSISSGVLGFVIPFLSIKPIQTGYNFMKSHPEKFIKASDKGFETFLRRFPHVDRKSVVDAKGNLKPMKEWLDREGNAFSTELKDVRKIFKPKHVSELSNETLKEKFVGIDLAKTKGVSANKWVDKNGNKVSIDLNDIYIAVDDGKNIKYYPLEHVEPDILKEVYPNLDVNSVGGTGRERLHPDKWLSKDGNKFNFDMDSVFVSHAREYSDKDVQVIPLITGKTRVDAKTGAIKDVCYQKNNIESDKHSLGTAILSDMADIEEANKIQDKFGGWLPDVLIAVPRAMLTIALIPAILKYGFGVEKTKKKKITEPVRNQEEGNANTAQVAFKGKGKSDGLIKTWMAKIYGKSILTSKTIRNTSEKAGRINHFGSMTNHMQTAGSFLTSGTYMYATMQNENFDRENARTLSINQGLGFIIPTIAAYLTDYKLNNFNRQLEYKFGAIQEREMIIKNISSAEKKKAEKMLSDSLKGFRTLIGIATFTLIYRYLTPVLITPIANKMGRWLNERIAEKENAKKDVV